MGNRSTGRDIAVEARHREISRVIRIRWVATRVRENSASKRNVEDPERFPCEKHETLIFDQDHVYSRAQSGDVVIFLESRIS